jgi:hypothetical protein
MIDFASFLTELATFMAATASPAIQFAGTPRGLFVTELVEKDSTLARTIAEASRKPASVLSIFDGSIEYVPVPHVMVQCMTTALENDPTSGLRQAQKLHGALLDADERPLRNKVLPVSGSPLFRLSGILNLRSPQQVGRDASDRVMVSFNFEVKFVPLT